jgi:hypothetical protein
MKLPSSIFISAGMIAAGLAVGCLLNGCAHEHSKKAVYEPIEPAHWASGTKGVGSSTNSRLAYQWYLTNGSQPTAEFTVEAAGEEHLHYVWHFKTNDEAASGTNGGLRYQWYKNTNE